MKIKYGKFEIELPYEEYLLRFSKMGNPFGTMSQLPSQDFFNDLMKQSRASFKNHLNEYKKWIEKLEEPDKSNISEE